MIRLFISFTLLSFEHLPSPPLLGMGGISPPASAALAVKTLSLAFSAFLLFAGCEEQEKVVAKLPTPFAIDLSAPPSAKSSGVTPKLTVFASGLSEPWGMAFLPDGRLLVTRKGGSLVLVSLDGATVSSPITAGVPAVDRLGQGGLLDVVLDPHFNLATNRRIYIAYSEPGPLGTNGTAVARADLNVTFTALENVTVIFQQMPKKSSTAHYGSRLIFRPDGTLFVLLGERFSSRTEAQLLESQLGKVVRIKTDGTIPSDNPYVSKGGNAAAVWSYGHRNVQAGALHPTTGELWVAEHGPQGGDEVNLALAERNFGWPNVSYGCDYGQPIGTACRIGGGVHAKAYTEPLAYWYPTSMAPGGAAFYTGNKFPEWQGSFFVGGLRGNMTLYRLMLNGNTIVGQEPFFAGEHEIRDIKQGPDGWLYIISRNANQILRVER
jgi:glucose/arabinose dehydrogenase